MREDDTHLEFAIPVPVLAIAADRARRMMGHCLERVAAAKADRPARWLIDHQHLLPPGGHALWET